jgi:hypothetical protein
VKNIFTFIILIITTSTCWATPHQEPIKFKINFAQCIDLINPLILSQIYTKEFGPVILSCTKAGDLYFCSSGPSDLLYSSKEVDEDDDSVHFGNSTNSDNIYVKGRIAIYSKVLVKDSIMQTITCNGIYTSERDLENSIVLKLNSGFKKIKEQL